MVFAMPRQSIVLGERQVRRRRSAACAGAGAGAGAGHAPAGVCVHQVQCTPRLLAAAELLDRIKCGIAKKRLRVAVGVWSSRRERRSR